MDHMIKEKFIVTDGEKVFLKKIYRKNRKRKKTLFWHGLIQESR